VPTYAVLQKLVATKLIGGKFELLA